jgi:exosortase/archaeosortase family protein
VTANQSGAPPSLFVVIRRAAVFLAVFALLQGLWGAARGTAVERVAIDGITVASAVALINLATPAVHAVAAGTRIRAPGGGINILNGCEGVEVLFLLAAALCAFPLPPRRRVAGLAAGVLFVFAINQIRILALFYVFRADRALFGLLHGTVAPVVLIALTVLFFLAWTKVGASGTASDATAPA